jgi:hypothetical protein
MTTYALADLIVPTTEDAELSALLTEAASRGLVTTTWQEGDPELTILEVLADELALDSKFAALTTRAGFLDLAVPTDADTAADVALLTIMLRVLARSMFGVAFIEATFATCTARLTNATASAIPIAAGDLTFAHDTSGATYRNTTGGTIPAGSHLDVSIMAEVAGSGGSAVVGSITTMVTPILGVTASNTTAAIGTDAESNEALVRRCRASLGALSPNGPARAYEFVALSAVRSDGTTVGVNRVRTVGGTGSVAVFIATASGDVPGGDVTIVNAAIQASAVSIGVTATVASATEVAVPVTVDVYVRSAANLSTAAVQAAVSARLGTFFAELPIGGRALPGETLGSGVSGHVFRDAIIGEVWRSVQSSAVQVDVTAPSADVDLAEYEVATLGTLTINVYQVVT